MLFCSPMLAQIGVTSNFKTFRNEIVFSAGNQGYWTLAGAHVEHLGFQLPTDEFHP